MVEMNLEDFYEKKIKPLIIDGLTYVHIQDAIDDVNFWKTRAELFNEALLVIDAFVYDKRRVEQELNNLKMFVKGLKGDRK